MAKRIRAKTRVMGQLTRPASAQSVARRTPSRCSSRPKSRASSRASNKEIVSESLSIQQPKITPMHANFLRETRKQLDNEAESETSRLDSLLRQRILSMVHGEQTPVARAFVKFDLSRCGRLEYESFRKAIETLGLEDDFSEEKTLGLFKHYDRDGKGFITLTDFQACVSGFDSMQFPNGSDMPRFPHVETLMPCDKLHKVLKQKISEKRASSHDLIDAFKLFSPNRHGIVTLDRFKDGLRLLGIQTAESSAEQLFEQFREQNWAGFTFNRFVRQVFGQQYREQDGFVAQLEEYVPRQAKLGKIAIGDLAGAGANRIADFFREKIFQHASNLFTLRKAFRMFDLDDSGRIELHEFAMALGNIGLNLSEHDVERLFSQFAKGKSGIAYNDFLHDILHDGFKPEQSIVQQLDRFPKTPYRPKSAPLFRDPLRADEPNPTDIVVNAIVCRPTGLYNHIRSFQKFDKNSHGEITKEAFLKRLRHFLGVTEDVLNDTEIIRVFDDADFDKNGSLSHYEFQQLLSKDEVLSLEVDRPEEIRTNAPRLPRPFSRSDIETEQLLIDKIRQKCLGVNQLKKSVQQCSDKSEISLQEFKEFCNKLEIGTSEKSIARLFDKYKDHPDSNVINYDRFIDILMRQGYNPNEGLAGQFAERQLKKAKQPVFNICSTHINVDRLIQEKLVARSHGRQRLRRAFKRFDLDDSRSIDFKEFARGMEILGVFLNDCDMKKVFDSYVPPGADHINYHDFVDKILHSQISTGFDLKCLRTEFAAKKRNQLLQLKEKRKKNLQNTKEVEMMLNKEKLRDQLKILEASRPVSFPEFVDQLRKSDQPLSAHESRILYDHYKDDRNGGVQYHQFLQRMLNEPVDK